MSMLDIGWWIVMVVITFFVFFLVSMILRNKAAKIDWVQKSKKDEIANSVSLSPKKNTKKLN